MEKQTPTLMEKQIPKWRKVLGKGVFVVVCILAALLLLAGAIYGTYRVQRCMKGEKVVASPTPTPEPTPVPQRLYSADRHLTEAPPLDKLHINEGHIEDFTEELSDPTHWIVLTPNGAEGFEVIRSIDIGCTFLVQDGEYYRLGEGENGKGAVDVILTDFDCNDEPDLLYTYHFGANEEERSKVGWFDLNTHRSVLSDFSLMNGFLALEETDESYVLYRAERNADLDTGSFGLNLTERLGEVTEEDGRILLMIEPPETPEPTAEP